MNRVLLISLGIIGGLAIILCFVAPVGIILYFGDLKDYHFDQLLIIVFTALYIEFGVQAFYEWWQFRYNTDKVFKNLSIRKAVPLFGQSLSSRYPTKNSVTKSIRDKLFWVLLFFAGSFRFIKACFHLEWPYPLALLLLSLIAGFWGYHRTKAWLWKNPKDEKSVKKPRWVKFLEKTV